MNNRRKLVIALGAGALAGPLVSLAQQLATKVLRIGFLGVESASALATRLEALRAGLSEFGYIEGKNIAIEFRWAEGKNDRLPDLAADLVRSGVDLIVTYGTPGTRAAKQATTTIPIVMAASGDPVANGIVASLARPGGNITGSTFFPEELAAKLLELLKDALPRTRRVALLLNPDNSALRQQIKLMEITARSLKMELQQFKVRSPNEFKTAFSEIARKRVDAVSVLEDSMFIANVKELADLASKHRVPSIGFKELAEVGGLLGYGVNRLELWRRAAYFVDRIFKGTKPGDIPVERPIKFELVVNMKTAKALGIKIPNSILVQATKVIN